MSGDFVVRAAVPEDEPEQVFDVLGQLAPDDARPDATRLTAAWRDLHAQAGRRLLLAVAGETVVGTLDTLVVPNLTHGARPYMVVENVVVARRLAPSWRRPGPHAGGAGRRDGGRLLQGAAGVERGAYRRPPLLRLSRVRAVGCRLPQVPRQHDVTCAGSTLHDAAASIDPSRDHPPSLILARLWTCPHPTDTATPPAAGLPPPDRAGRLVSDAPVPAPRGGPSTPPRHRSTWMTAATASPGHGPSRSPSWWSSSPTASCSAWRRTTT